MELGKYIKTHEEHNNTMQLLKIGAITTRPSNDVRGNYFISLSTGCDLNRHSWMSIPMPAEVNVQVHHLARQAKAKKTLTFTTTCDDDVAVIYTTLN